MKLQICLVRKYKISQSLNPQKFVFLFLEAPPLSFHPNQIPCNLPPFPLLKLHVPSFSSPLATHLSLIPFCHQSLRPLQLVHHHPPSKPDSPLSTSPFLTETPCPFLLKRTSNPFFSNTSLPPVPKPLSKLVHNHSPSLHKTSIVTHQVHNLYNYHSGIEIKGKKLGVWVVFHFGDKSRNASTKKQLAIVVRFVDLQGCVIECFLGIVHVSDTTSQSLKMAIDALFSKHGLNISQLRRHAMGLKTLIMKENGSAYCINYFGYQLQLSLAGVAKKNVLVSSIYNTLFTLVNVVHSSFKRQEILREK
ncbi:hypothetical protein ACH5RR_039706 [Cinchona calisaya]|uniref:DUF4371 domain-containing protein n=1 Tax=Cinchona calisaya TaxID=153742 RepID=A0ABD2Y4M0_9GENT